MIFPSITATKITKCGLGPAQAHWRIGNKFMQLQWQYYEKWSVRPTEADGDPCGISSTTTTTTANKRRQ